MALTTDLISQFVKATKDTEKKKTETTVYGTTVDQNGTTYVRIDGSDTLTPVVATADTQPGERVIVTIKNHTAIITGNISSPAARVDDIEDVSDIVDKIAEFEIIIADTVSTEELEAESARIDSLVAEDVLIKQQLSASEADIDNIQANTLEITDSLTAAEGEITRLETEKLDAAIAEITYATIEDLEVTDANIHNLEATYADFESTTTTTLTAHDASIFDLQVKKLDATEAEITYANIDFSNIGKAAIEYFYSTSGIIKDLVIGDETITGELVGVTIKGDLIEGNTVVADKLVIKGENGLYYKLNTDGITTEAEQTDYNSLNGKVIRAKSVTAEKISVKDLVAFDATIAGFNITESALYSGVKDSVANTTRGIYLGKDGQVAFGDSNNFIKYYKDENGAYKLAISADSLVFSSGNSNLEETINDIKNDVNSLKDEISTVLRIESSRGTVFKNDSISTVLSVVLYHGTSRITDSETMKQVFGNSAYIQWKWQKLDEDSYGVILSDDHRISNGGFTFTVSPEDVNTKVTFMCELIN